MTVPLLSLSKHYSPPRLARAYSGSMSDRIRYPIAMYPGISATNSEQASSDRQEQLEDLQRSIPDCVPDDPQRCAMFMSSVLDVVVCVGPSSMLQLEGATGSAVPEHHDSHTHVAMRCTLCRRKWRLQVLLPQHNATASVPMVTMALDVPLDYPQVRPARPS